MELSGWIVAKNDKISELPVVVLSSVKSILMNLTVATENDFQFTTDFSLATSYISFTATY